VVMEQPVKPQVKKPLLKEPPVNKPLLKDP
jgi:hypothetical protein